MEESNELKDRLKKDKHLFFLLDKSPRIGVKALYRIIEVADDSHLKEVFAQVKEVYPELDDSGKDISGRVLKVTTLIFILI